ncbi:beta-ketoacyl-ACP synthase II [Longimicrobium terrae]|uniref:3-oxoacyl-[acyl-carrier-protein] synthase 2 n=1 Tax=Longimicrobium terrae TaxID=1639882 RepID=A0A841H3Y4_9BACT|nr:beta-ketoacyl-ACP synthase II [Longimicrobium terrae]MBB4638469.1 3-oxoacyl-[acyl-carrier-protein] synthase II [Longimicrobium terrae]MBB6072688.1 3-oxoacyl-[acyl-carrier-protein] synthase II [Longimicrobium terrae]NNC32438.1 beta-ketoacyl-ACP synthase II [Longimicrobium terrae]
MPTQRTPGERVVVTGLGVVSPVGIGVEESWKNLMAGVSGAATITAFDSSAFSTTFACEVKGFRATDHMDRKLANRTDLFTHYAVASAAEAIRDAGLRPEAMTQDARDRTGVIFGSGQGGLRTFQEQTRAYLEGGPRRLSPFFVPMMIVDMAPGIISMQYGFRGPNHSVVSACATGNHNLADAMMAIQRGEADVMITGGSEASICELGLGGFAAMRALSTRNDAPERASRPFDADRDGFVMGEGAGALVLESLAHARARGARIHAEVLAVGAAADAYHMTAPHPEGAGAVLAMRRALAQAGVNAGEVGTINMHGTSTPLGDASESAAIRTVFGEHADRITPTSTKSMTGHMLGAAGAMEAVASVLSLVHQAVPPTINFQWADPGCDLPYALNQAVHRPISLALSNAFGFGGHNTTAVFRAWEE